MSAAYKGTSEPRRAFVDYKPASGLHLADRFAPEADAHHAHVEAVLQARRAGFPAFAFSKPVRRWAA